MTDYTWVGGSGTFSDPNQWENDSSGKDGDGSPGSGDFAHFGAAGLNTNAGTVSGGGSVSEIDISGGVTFGDGTVTVGSLGVELLSGNLTVGAGATLDASAGNITAFNFTGGEIDVAGGTLKTANGLIGSLGSGDTVTVAVTGGTWDGGLTFGTADTGVLQVTGGSTIDGDGNLDNTTATVSGSTWTGGFILGPGAASTLTATGSTLNLTDAAGLNVLGGSAATVSGGTLNAPKLNIGITGSTVSLTGVATALSPTEDQFGLGLDVGAGTTFTVSGGTLTNSGQTFFDGAATISGATTSFADDVGIGTGVAGTLNVENGAKLAVTGKNNDLALGLQQGGQGRLVVSDAKVSTAASIDEGYGKDAITVKAGGTLAAKGEMEIGIATGSDATATITGKGSVLTLASHLIVGDQGTGAVTVENGAAATVANNVAIGGDKGGKGTVTVESGASFKVTGATHDLDLGVVKGAGASKLVVNDATASTAGNVIAGYGKDTITVQGGGTLNAMGDVALGTIAGAVVTAAVTGTDSTLTAGGILEAGVKGTGHFTVENGAAATAKWVELGLATAGSGDLTVDKATVTASAGTTVGGKPGTAGGTGTIDLGKGGDLDAGDKLVVWGHGTVDAGAKTASLEVGDAAKAGGTFAVGTGGTVANHGGTIEGFAKAVLSGTASYAGSAGADHGLLAIDDSLTTRGSAKIALSGGSAITVGSPADQHANALSIGDGGTVTLGGGGDNTAIWLEGGTLTVAKAAAAGSKAIHFDGGGTLVVDAGVTLHNVVAGFAAGDTLDFRGVAFAKSEAVALSGNVLTVNEGGTSQSVDLSGSYTQAEFHLASDGHGGTDVTLGAAHAGTAEMAFLHADLLG